MLFSLVYITYCKICDQSSKVLIAEVKVIYFAQVWSYFRLKKKIVREKAEKKEKLSVVDIKNIGLVSLWPYLY